MGWAINAKSDKWLMIGEKCSFPKMLNDDALDFKFRELIDAEVRQWDVEKSRANFDTTTVEEAKTIHVIRNGGEDRLFWAHRK